MSALSSNPTRLERYLYSIHAHMMGKDYLERDGLRSPIDWEFVRRIEPADLQRAQADRFRSEQLVRYFTLRAGDIKLENMTVEQFPDLRL